MSTTRYKIRLWEYDGEASVANAVTFDSFDEAQARFNDLHVSEEMPCVEFIKERIASAGRLKARTQIERSGTR